MRVNHAQVHKMMAIDGSMPIVARVGKTIYGLEDLKALVVCKAELGWHIVDDDQLWQ